MYQILRFFLNNLITFFALKSKGDSQGELCGMLSGGCVVFWYLPRDFVIAYRDCVSPSSSALVKEVLFWLCLLIDYFILNRIVQVLLDQENLQGWRNWMILVKKLHSCRGNSCGRLTENLGVGEPIKNIVLVSVTFFF